MSETPRGPDRYDKRVGELARHVEELIFDGDEECGSRLRWSLRRMTEEVEAETLERAAQVADKEGAQRTSLGLVGQAACITVAHNIRALASPAAAFACGADMESDGHLYRCDRGADHTGPHGERDYAEWTDETHHDAPPSEPVAPAPDLRCEACGDRLADEDAMHAHDRTWHGAAEAELLDRISELEAALRELTRAATEHANAHGCSGDLGARLSDAKALLAARTSPRGAGEGKT